MIQCNDKIIKRLLHNLCPHFYVQYHTLRNQQSATKDIKVKSFHLYECNPKLAEKKCPRIQDIQEENIVTFLTLTYNHLSMPTQQYVYTINRILHKSLIITGPEKKPLRKQTILSLYRKLILSVQIGIAS